MSYYFTLFTKTPWDNLSTEQLTPIRLLSLKSIFQTFPVIEEDFFDDLFKNVYNYSHYSFIKCIKRIIGPKNEDYDITNWSLLWAFDDQRRMFQFLFQKVKSQKNRSQAVLAALAPPELGKLFSQFKAEAILRTLSLLNTPQKFKFLIVLAPKGKSIVEEYKFHKIDKSKLDKLKYMKTMADMPNIAGQWFPNYAPRCPVCNEILKSIQDYRIGFGKLVCQRCGYERSK